LFTGVRVVLIGAIVGSTGAAVGLTILTGGGETVSTDAEVTGLVVIGVIGESVIGAIGEPVNGVELTGLSVGEFADRSFI